MIGRARQRAALVLDRNVEVLGAAGCAEEERPGPLEARLSMPSGPALTARMVPKGRVFGGVYAFELATAEPVLPESAGVAIRGRGVVASRGFAVRPRRGDERARDLAAQLENAADALAGVDFETVRVEPDGRIVLRHLGGSLVWLFLPPMLYPVRLTPEQAERTPRAIAALAQAGASAATGRR